MRKQGLPRSAPHKYPVANSSLGESTALASLSRNSISRRVWRELKQMIYERDQGTCRSPLDCPYKEPFSLLYCESQLDHIVPRSRGGSDCATNLRTLCAVCHSLRAGQEHKALRKGLIRKGLLPADVSDLLW